MRERARQCLHAQSRPLPTEVQQFHHLGTVALGVTSPHFMCGVFLFALRTDRQGQLVTLTCLDLTGSRLAKSHRHHPSRFHCANLHRDRNLQHYLVVSRRPRQREWPKSWSTRSWFMRVSYLASTERKVDNEASFMIRISVPAALDQDAPAARQRGNGSRARLVFQ